MFAVVSNAIGVSRDRSDTGSARFSELDFGGINRAYAARALPI